MHIPFKHGHNILQHIYPRLTYVSSWAKWSTYSHETKTEYLPSSWWTAAGLSIFPMSFVPMNLWPSFIERNFQTFWPKLFCEAGDFSWSAKLQFFSDVWRRSALVCLQKWQQRQTWCWMEIQPLLFLLQGIMLVDNPERPQRMVVWLRMKWVFCVHTLSMGAVNFRKQD